jgi:hypothetical protein
MHDSKPGLINDLASESVRKELDDGGLSCLLIRGVLEVHDVRNIALVERAMVE